MKLETFVSRKRDTWNRLDYLVRAHQDVRRASEEDLAEMIRLYRAVCADYAYARSNYPYDRIVPELTGLIGRSHHRIYGSRPFRLASVWSFFAYDFPQNVRSNAGTIGSAMGVFLLAAVFAFLGSLENPDLPRHLLGDAYVDITLDHIDKNDPFAIYKQDSSPVMSSFIMTNNIKVTFVAFGMGIFFGIGTVYVMIHNGLILGVFFFVFHQHGLLLDALLTVMMHGVIELTCVFIAGGAGLLLGKALLFPGRFTRSDALRTHGMSAIRLVIGLIPLLVVAGIVEGFVTGMVWPSWVKLAFVTTTVLLLTAYLGLSRTASP